MAEIGISLTSNVSEVRNDFQGLQNDIRNISNTPMVEGSDLPSLLEGPDLQQQSIDKMQNLGEKSNQLKEKIEKTDDSLGTVNDTLNKLIDTLLVSNQNKSTTIPGSSGVGFGGGSNNNSGNTAGSANGVVTSSLQGLNSSINNGAAVVGNVANGNISGAYISGVSGVSNAMQSGSNVAKLAGAGELAAGLGIAGLVIAGVAGAMKGADSLAQKYEDALPTMDKMTNAFNNGEYDQSLALHQRNQALKYNQYTNLTNNDFLSYMSGYGSFGITDINNAALMTQAAAKYALNTNGDISQFNNFLGTMTRYGSKNAVGDLDYAYSTALASGLSSNQMPEFMNSLERIIEDGISKGYVRSTKDVADTLNMFSKLSGDSELWKGEQGANRLTMLNSGLAGATGLNSSTDVLAYRAVDNLVKNRKYGYIDTMMAMEQGINADNFGAIADTLFSQYGSDETSIIESLRQLGGLNYTGAEQLYSMMRNYRESGDTASSFAISKIVGASEYSSDSTRMQNSLNNIEKTVVQMGQSIFNAKMALTIESIETGVSILAKDKLEKEYKEAIGNYNKMYSSANGGIDKEYYLDSMPSDISGITDEADKVAYYKIAANAPNLLNYTGADGLALHEQYNYVDFSKSPTEILAQQQKIQTAFELSQAITGNTYLGSVNNMTSAYGRTRGRGMNFAGSDSSSYEKLFGSIVSELTDSDTISAINNGGYGFILNDVTSMANNAQSNTAERNTENLMTLVEELKLLVDKLNLSDEFVDALNRANITVY